jgi:aldose 1-epimerase
MFSIQSIHQAGFDIIALIDGDSGTQAEIIPAHSALLHAFRIPHGEGFLNIIDSYESLDDYKVNLPEYYKSAKLSPFACRIPAGTYRWEEQEYTIRKTLSTSGSAIHGLLYDVPFEVVSKEASEKGAVLTLRHTYTGNDAGYPFPYDCEVKYHLEPGQQLRITTFILNNAEVAIPVMDGWHPYFSTGTPVDELELQFASEQIVEFNAQLIPTGNVLPYDRFLEAQSLAGIPLDNSFLLDFSRHSALATLRDPQKRVLIHFFPEPCYPVLQIYIPANRNSIAIEHLTGAPNAFNNGMGLVTLEPGEEKVFSTAITAIAY